MRWRSGLVVTRWSRSTTLGYSTLGPVTTRMGKPSHLSQAVPMCMGGAMSNSDSWGVNRHTMYAMHSPRLRLILLTDGHCARYKCFVLYCVDGLVV